MTTLDHLIQTFGRPAFCKIDVEGLEAEILDGLSQPLPLLAFEYLAEAPEVSRACVARLDELGQYRFNLVVGEGSSLRHEEWIDGGAVLAEVARIGGSGDIYARLASA